MIRNRISDSSFYSVGISGNLDEITFEAADHADHVNLHLDAKQAQELRDILDRTILSLKALKNTPNKPLDKNFPNSPSDKPIREEMA